MLRATTAIPAAIALAALIVGLMVRDAVIQQARPQVDAQLAAQALVEARRARGQENEQSRQWQSFKAYGPALIASLKDALNHRAMVTMLAGFSNLSAGERGSVATEADYLNSDLNEAQSTEVWGEAEDFKQAVISAIRGYYLDILPMKNYVSSANYSGQPDHLVRTHHDEYVDTPENGKELKQVKAQLLGLCSKLHAPQQECLAAAHWEQVEFFQIGA